MENRRIPKNLDEWLKQETYSLNVSGVNENIDKSVLDASTRKDEGNSSKTVYFTSHPDTFYERIIDWLRNYDGRNN